MAIAATLALAAEPPRKVLVVYSDNRLLPGLAVIDETLDSVLRTEYGPEIQLLNRHVAGRSFKGRLRLLHLPNQRPCAVAQSAAELDQGPIPLSGACRYYRCITRRPRTGSALVVVSQRFARDL